MKSVDFVKLSLEMSKGWIMGLAADIKDAPLTAPTPNGGNHPLWCLGHLVYSEASMISTLCKGEPNPLEAWKELFEAGTKPQADAGVYPSYDEILAKFEETRAATMAYLDTLTDEDLDKPSKAEGDMKDWFGTIAQCLAATPIHYGFHGGQIADARRAAGRSVLMG
jgi:hypothetical protein